MKLIRAAYRCGGTFLLLLVLSLGILAPAAAQDGTSKPGTTIHVVQRDENLYRIALRYGTTVDAIAEANGISDPRYLAVGQRLLIPNAGTNVTGTVTMHTIGPGDTLATLAKRYQSTPEQLATANRITNPNLLYIGQTLSIPFQMEQDTTAAASHHIYHVTAGENLARIAIAHNVPLHALLQANTLSGLMPVFAGQKLWVPGDDPAGSVQDVPPPFTSASLSPIPAVQGKTLSITLTTRDPVTVTGTFMGYPVQIVTQHATQHYALFGVHAFAAAGVYPLVLTATDSSGSQTTVMLRVRVEEGGYGSEAISLATEQQDLLAPQVTGPEWERFARLMSNFSAQRYFDGVMGLPSTGAITSKFGTRRSYNGGVLDTFHSGTDFAGPPGSEVVAPAGGVVLLAENLPVRGNTVLIDHGWGVVTGYFHQAEIKVAVGDTVTSGQVIGTVGSTGRSTGPHLHWEMWVGGVQVDPMQWVQRSFP